MISRLAVLLVMVLLPFDIIYDIFFQLNFRSNFASALNKLPAVRDFIAAANLEHFEHAVKHSVSHTIQHLLVHLLLTHTTTAFLITALSAVFCESSQAFTKTLNFLFLSPFLTLSVFEMLLLQLEHAILMYFECSSYFFHMFGENILVHALWIIMIIFFFVPIEVRLKVYIEHKLHYVAPIAMAAMFAVGEYIFRYVSFKIDLDVLHQLGSIKDRFETLHRFVNDGGIPVHFYSSTSRRYDRACSALSMLSDKNIIIYGDLSRFTDREIEAALLHECCRFTFWGRIDSLLLPTLQKFLFAFFCIYVSKRFLKKHFSIPQIGHITGFLILEECLSMGLQKYLMFPITLARHAIEARADSIVSRAGLGRDYAKFLLVSEMDAQVSHINPSALYGFFNHENNLFERVGRLLESAN